MDWSRAGPLALALVGRPELHEPYDGSLGGQTALANGRAAPDDVETVIGPLADAAAVAPRQRVQVININAHRSSPTITNDAAAAATLSVPSWQVALNNAPEIFLILNVFKFSDELDCLFLGDCLISVWPVLNTSSSFTEAMTHQPPSSSRPMWTSSTAERNFRLC
jgi:hypothetical protein